MSLATTCAICFQARLSTHALAVGILFFAGDSPGCPVLVDPSFVGHRHPANSEATSFQGCPAAYFGQPRSQDDGASGLSSEAVVSPEQKYLAPGCLFGCAEAANDWLRPAALLVAAAHDFLISFERVHPSAAATNVIDGVEPSRRPDSLQLEVRLAALFRVAPLAACPWALPVARVIPRRLCISCTYERTPVAHG